MSNGPADADYARRLSKDCNALDREIAHLRTVELGNLHGGLKNGISVIIPTHGGAGRIHRALDSLVHQTLDVALFELVIIHNGKPDGTREVVRSFQTTYPEVSIRFFHRAVPSAGGARNLGLDLAKHTYLTFVDDDDWVEPRFLEALYTTATPETISVVALINAHPDGTLDTESQLSRRLRAFGRGVPRPLAEIPWLLGFNACKLIATELARSVQFNENLGSGEDLVYWASFLELTDITAVPAPLVEGTAYVRVLRDDSVSRKELDFQFSVLERLEVIRELERIPLSGPPTSRAWKARHELAQAQAAFIRRYIDASPDSRSRVADAVEASRIVDFPWSVLNRGLATDLVFSYCFAPFSDTSAVVASKVIAERGRMVDVISNDMSGVRNIDNAVSALADRWIDARIVIDAKPSFADWGHISEYAQDAVRAAERRHARMSGGYQSIYSRALWVGSHAAGALFKLRHWTVPWTAEFSDPLRTDAQGALRAGNFTHNELSGRLTSAILSKGYSVEECVGESLFALVEVATMVLADELIFTNQNQLDYMLDLTCASLRRTVLSKAVVRKHPSPPPKAYQLVPSSYPLPGHRLNIGYFGSFYDNRGLDEVLTAIANLPDALRRSVLVHVFTNKPKAFRARAAERGLAGNVASNGYIPYMEFLNALGHFDVLLVNDVERGVGMKTNPFLPSKLSDYVGANRPIWAIVDHGSELSRVSVQYRTQVGDVIGTIDALERMIAVWAGRKAGG